MRLNRKANCKLCDASVHIRHFDKFSARLRRRKQHLKWHFLPHLETNIWTVLSLQNAKKVAYYNKSTNPSSSVTIWAKKMERKDNQIKMWVYKSFKAIAHCHINLNDAILNKVTKSSTSKIWRRCIKHSCLECAKYNATMPNTWFDMGMVSNLNI